MVKHIKLGDQDYKLNLYELSGHENSHSFIKDKISDCPIIIFMYDVTEKETFDSIPNWIKTVKELNKNGGAQMFLIGS